MILLIPCQAGGAYLLAAIDNGFTVFELGETSGKPILECRDAHDCPITSMILLYQVMI